MATQRNPAKKAPARKAPARKKAVARPAARKKAPVRKPEVLTLKDRAQKGVNIYLGLWGVGYDLGQENLEYARENKLRMNELERRGERLRKQLRKNLDKFEARELDQMFDGVQGQLDRLQKRLEELARDMKDRVKPKKVARAA